MTLGTLITFLTIENNNINNYIVTFELLCDGDSIRNSCNVLTQGGISDLQFLTWFFNVDILSDAGRQPRPLCEH